MREDLILLALGTFEVERLLALQWPAWWEGNKIIILLSGKSRSDYSLRATGGSS